MKSIIVCTSVSHGNTARIADAMAGVLDARVVGPEQVDAVELANYDLVGFGSGIFGLDFHPQLRRFVDLLPRRRWAAAFVLTTSGLPEPSFRPYRRRFAQRLERKGFEVLDTFACRAFDTWLPFKAVGGIKKGRPDATDLHAAHAFAKGLRTQLDTRAPRTQP